MIQIRFIFGILLRWKSLFATEHAAIAPFHRTEDNLFSQKTVASVPIEGGFSLTLTWREVVALRKKKRSRFINRKLFLTRILHFFHLIRNLQWKSFRKLHICLYKIFPFWYRKVSLKLENLAVGKSKFDLMKISFQAKQTWSRLQLIIYR